MTETTKYGLSHQTLESILNVLTNQTSVEEVILFGSRAMGNFKEGSDIDLALTGHSLSMRTIRKIELQLDELLLPYHFDLAIYHKIKEPTLKEHIDNYGVKLFERSPLKQ